MLRASGKQRKGRENYNYILSKEIFGNAFEKTSMIVTYHRYLILLL